MATLCLIRYDDGSYGLQSTSHSTGYNDFYLFDLDGSGGDPYHGNTSTWDTVDDVFTVPYDDDDNDSFWFARDRIIEEAERIALDIFRKGR